MGTYRLLNPQQMLRIGVANSEESIRAEVRVLKRKHLLDHTEKGFVQGITAIPRLHWLSDRGAELLATGRPDDPLGARRELGELKHIEHRIKTVDVHIALRLWAAADGRLVRWFVTDFEPGSGGRRKLTTIRYTAGRFPRYTPDALADVIGPDGHSRLLVLEVERGRRQHNRLSDFERKLEQLHEVSAGSVVEDHFDRPRFRARFLVVFATAALRDRALAAWPAPNDPAWRNFFVKCDEDLADFNDSWWRPGGRSQRPLFSWASAPQGQATTRLPVA